MNCEYCEKCGGCSYTNLKDSVYETEKAEKFKQILRGINQPNITYGESVFIPANTRRRASFAFSNIKGMFKLGFNEKSSHDIVSISKCSLLTPMINSNIETIKTLVSELCQTPITQKVKKGKSSSSFITSGDIQVCNADNGLDIVIETKENLSLDHRMIVFETIQNCSDIIRVSHRSSAFDEAEVIAEKTKPIINISGVDVFISAGTFLQASKEGEKALIDLVCKYVGEGNHRIADLFCGIGTLSYPLSKNKNNKVLSVDSSQSLLDGFKKSINKNQITNIEIMQKNLFKYPLDKNDLQNIDIVVFDPPRAGAAAQSEKLIEASSNIKKIIAVSCNPHSFVKDANILISGGYNLEEITLVDQFTYSNHCELVALFTK